MSKKWTQKEVDYLCKNWKKKSVKALARALNRSVDAVDYKARNLGLSKNNRRWSRDDEEFVLQNYKKMTLQELAKSLDRTEEALYVKLNTMKLKTAQRCIVCNSLFWSNKKGKQLYCGESCQKALQNKPESKKVFRKNCTENPSCPICNQNNFVGKIDRLMDSFFCSQCYIEFIPGGPVYDINYDGSCEIVSC